MLKAMRRPRRSEPMPQMKLPMESPAKQALVVYLTVFSGMSNSADNEGRVNETPCVFIC